MQLTNLLHFNRGDDLVEVKSCFGGLALYKTSALSGRYTDEDCDHVTLHKSLPCMYLNPSQIVLYTEHYYENRFGRKSTI